MKKQELIAEVRQARADMMEALEGLPADAMLRPGVIGMWSIKDILAHLSIWQSELITALDQLDNPTRVPHVAEIEDIDEFNAEQYRVNVRRPLDVVIEDFEGVHKHLIKTIEELDEKILNDGRRFPWMEGEPLWYLIAENGYWHEQEHAEEIRAWREENEL